MANHKMGIFLVIEGITQYDDNGNPDKYFRKISPYDNGKPEVEEQLEREIREEYERNHQETEWERVRKIAQYLQDLENIRQHELKGKGKMEYFSITPQYLDEFWGIGSTPNCKLDVQGFVKATNFQKLRGDLSQIDGLLYFGAGSYDKLRFWFLKKAVYESYLEFIPSKLQVNYENDTPEEMKLKVDYIQNIEGIAEFKEQLQSEVEEVARNLSESLLIFEMGDEQQVLLFDVIRNMLYFRNHEPFQKLFTYAVLLFTQLEQIDKFSVDYPPPDMRTLLATQSSITTPQIMPQTSNEEAQRKPSVIVEQTSRAAFVAIFDAIQKQDIIKQMTDSAVAKLIGAKGKEHISAARNQKNSLSKKLYDFVLSLLQKAKLEELEQLEKDIKKIKANKFSNDAPLR